MERFLYTEEVTGSSPVSPTVGTYETNHNADVELYPWSIGSLDLASMEKWN